MNTTENTSTQQAAYLQPSKPAGSKSNNWKPVTIGGITGILMGAGTYHVANIQTSAEENLQPASLKTADSHDEMTFSEAFAAARHQVGAGGLFTWHGGIYNTYTADEWNAMNPSQKELFAQQVKPEVEASEIAAENISDAQPETLTAPAETAQATPEVVTFSETVAKTESSPAVDDEAELVANNEAEVVADARRADVSADVDVQIIGARQVLHDDGTIANVAYGTVDGHSAIIIDVNANGQADVAAIDINDNRQLDDDEVFDLHTGRELSVGTPGDSAEGGMMASDDDGSMDAVAMDADISLI